MIKQTNNKMNKRCSYITGLHKLKLPQIITLGFAGVIILGITSVAASFCTAPGYHIFYRCHVYRNHKYMCVTGLVTVVTVTHWTLAGKILFFVLIQIGGVGLISLGSIIFISLRKKISLRNRRSYPGVPIIWTEWVGWSGW